MAGSSDQELQIHIAGRADSSLNSAVSTAQKALSGLGEIAGTIAKAAAIAVGAVTTAAVGFAKSAVDVGMEFDSSMSQVAATMGYSVEELNTAGSEANETYDQLRSFAMEMGQSTAFSATQAADALNYMALAGYDAETSMTMLPNVLNLAAAGGMELATASDMVTDAQSALGLTLDETTEMVDKMAKASSKSNTSVAQLGEAMLTVGGMAQNLAGGTTELSTALGILADNDVKGAEGGTHLRNIILSLSSPTDKAAAALKSLGVEVFDAEGNMRPLNETLGDLNSAMSTMTQADRINIISTIFNKTDLPSVTALLAGATSGLADIGAALESSGVDWEKYADKAWGSADSVFEGLIADIKYNLVDLGTSAEELQEYLQFEYDLDAEDAMAVVRSMGTRWDELAGYIEDADGAAADMANTQKDNLAGDITFWQSALEGAQIVLSDQLTPSLREFVQFGTNGLTQVTKAFKEDGISGAMQALGGVLGDTVNMIAEMLPTMVDTGIQLLGALGQGIIDNLPIIIDAAVQIVLMLASGIIEAMPHLGAAALQIIQQLASGITEHLPELVSMGKEFLAQLAEGTRTGIPELITTVVGLIPEIISAILSLMPDILNAGMEIIQGIADGIVQAIPILISYLPQLITQIVEFLTSSLPQILEQGVVILENLTMGIIQAIPQLMEQLPQIIQTICDFVIQNLPNIINQGVNLLINLTMGIIQAIPQLMEQLPQIISSITTTLAQNLPQIITAGIEILLNLADGLIGAIPQLVAQLPQIVSAILQGIGAAVTGVVEIGENIVQGVWDGISAMGSWIKDKVSGFFGGIVDGVKGFLGIHSPSKVFAGIGGYMAEGLGEGWDDEYAAVKSSIEDGLNFNAGTVGIDTAINAAGSTPTATNQPPELIAPAPIQEQTVQAVQMQAVPFVQVPTPIIEEAPAIQMPTQTIQEAPPIQIPMQEMQAAPFVQVPTPIIEEAPAVQIPAPTVQMAAMQTEEMQTARSAPSTMNLLSSLWDYVQDMTASTIGTAKDWIGNALDTFAGGDDNSQTYTDNSQQPIQITYSPQYIFTGESPSKDDLVEAEKMSQDEFSRMANQWLKEISRTSLKGALI